MRALSNPRPPQQSFPVYLGDRIKKARRFRSLRQRELALKANFDSTLVSRYESGTHLPTARRLWAIARTLTIPVDWFLPALDFPEPADRVLYRFLRNIWLYPVEVRRAAARLVEGLLEESRTTAATGRSDEEGGGDASR